MSHRYPGHGGVWAPLDNQDEDLSYFPRYFLPVAEEVGSEVEAYEQSYHQERYTLEPIDSRFSPRQARSTQPRFPHLSDFSPSVPGPNLDPPDHSTQNPLPGPNQDQWIDHEAFAPASYSSHRDSEGQPLSYPPQAHNSQTYRGAEDLFEEPPSPGPQLVPPHRPDGYNPLLNPYVPQKKELPVQKKKRAWNKRRRGRFSKRSPINLPGTRRSSLVGDSVASEERRRQVLDCPRPSPPTPTPTPLTRDKLPHKVHRKASELVFGRISNRVDTIKNWFGRRGRSEPLKPGAENPLQPKPVATPNRLLRSEVGQPFQSPSFFAGFPSYHRRTDPEEAVSHSSPGSPPPDRIPSSRSREHHYHLARVALGIDSSPPLDRCPSPPLDRFPSPPLDRFPSPLLDRFSRPLLDRISSPSLDRFSSTSRDRFSSPSLERFPSPSIDRFPSPSIHRLPSPSPPRAPSPPPARSPSPLRVRRPNQLRARQGNLPRARQLRRAYSRHLNPPRAKRPSDINKTDLPSNWTDNFDPNDQLPDTTPRSVGRQQTYESLFGERPSTILFSENTGRWSGGSESSNNGYKIPRYLGNERIAEVAELRPPFLIRGDNTLGIQAVEGGESPPNPTTGFEAYGEHSDLVPKRLNISRTRPYRSHLGRQQVGLGITPRDYEPEGLGTGTVGGATERVRQGSEVDRTSQERIVFPFSKWRSASSRRVDEDLGPPPFDFGPPGVSTQELVDDGPTSPSYSAAIAPRGVRNIKARFERKAQEADAGGERQPRVGRNFTLEDRPRRRAWKLEGRAQSPLDVPDQVGEDVADVEDLYFGPAPPIPRKSSKRVAKAGLPLAQGFVVAPVNKSKVGQRVESECSISVHSESEHHTPPEGRSGLKPFPAAIKKVVESHRVEAFALLIFPTGSYPFRTPRSFTDNNLSDSAHITQMETLQVTSAARSSTRTKAVEDARAMQQTVIDGCKKAGKDPPKYVLLELIGKGSFGRVYKGKDVISTAIVAVKIIDIDESDTLNPRQADTYSEFMKEVNALKILSDSKARNINHVIEALPVGKAMWMITEYCGGGSIATLMKPTPKGLKERFIIPILREVAEAVKWVHQAGIIHRDLKCANVLITEKGGLQLCDFGVAGITETALDKRSTFIGTPHWMAPELFQGSSYGREVDIWAFGSMTYEMATGLPPNAMSGVSGTDLGPYLKTHIPRLEGGSYSEGLRSIVAFCLEESPRDRPTIEAVQRHSYIHNTGVKYPALWLSDLVRAFKMWENDGGIRKSLFMAGGAQGPSDVSPTSSSDDSWNFSTTPAFDQAVEQDTNAQDVINVYGFSDFQDETSRPSRQQPQSRQTRRRPPPEALAPLKAPLEKIFDPNTISNYEDNSRQHYNQHQSTGSDLPLRQNTDHTSIRDTMIDLDALEVPSGPSSFMDMDTIRPGSRVMDDSEDTYSSGLHDFIRPSLSDPADNPNRRTQDWKFPVLAPPASANPELSRFPVPYELQKPSITPAVGVRPPLIHHPTEPISQTSNSLMPSAPPSPNRMSLIDLDFSVPESSRPSTADSTVSQEHTSANPFHLERHASLYHPSAREPSLYLADDSAPAVQMRTRNTIPDHNDFSDFSASDTEGSNREQYNGNSVHNSDSEPSFEDSAFAQPDSDPLPAFVSRPRQTTGISSRPHSEAAPTYSMAHFPDLPPPPSAAALSGTAPRTEMSNEMQRMLGGLKAQLESFRDVYEGAPSREHERRSRAGTNGDVES